MIHMRIHSLLRLTIFNFNKKSGTLELVPEVIEDKKGMKKRNYLSLVFDPSAGSIPSSVTTHKLLHFSVTPVAPDA